MNYSNMIEEKNLKKTFIIATLVSTLVGTFTSSLGLYERLQMKHNQKNTDNGQDDKLTKLQKRLDQVEQRGGKSTDEPKRIEGRKDDLEESLESSGPMIKKAFDKDLQRFGKQFAIGDSMTETQLQAQIIALQQTVITILEDALYNDRNISKADLSRLFHASESAREGSLSALQHQYQRMLTAAPTKGNHSPLRRALPQVAASSPSLIDTSPLFCKYSTDVQRSANIPLAPDFQAGGNNTCPACDIQLAVEAGRAWKIVKEIEHVKRSTPEFDDVVIEERTFHLSNRFVIKCHRDNGQFACCLCSRNRTVDTIWETPNSLVKHVWRAHEAEEYENEADIREVG